jgi:hypothetical protein
MLDGSEVIRQVQEERKNLSKLVEYEVRGMAYPCGGVNNDLQDNLYRFNPTIQHTEWDELEKLVKEFIDLRTEKPV